MAVARLFIVCPHCYGSTWGQVRGPWRLLLLLQGLLFRALGAVAAVAAAAASASCTSSRLFQQDQLLRVLSGAIGTPQVVTGAPLRCSCGCLRWGEARGPPTGATHPLRPAGQQLLALSTRFCCLCYSKEWGHTVDGMLSSRPWWLPSTGLACMLLMAMPCNCEVACRRLTHLASQ
jgi:hypothetical protein